QAEPGVAGGALDEDRTGADVAAALRGLDHVQADPVLDRTAGVVAFQLEVQLADAGVQALGLDDGGVPDQFEDGCVDRHALAAAPARNGTAAIMASAARPAPPGPAG